ncbi:MAG: LemA family protein [Desulfobacteraceae bacterium]|nr:LemA family protein [Desulfobacteraceae bacterium]
MKIAANDDTQFSAREGLLKFATLCLIVLGIILFCVVFGGYSSLARSKSRIEASKNYLTDSCLKRQQLLPQLIELGRKSNPELSTAKINQAAEKADSILQEIAVQKTPIEDDLIKAFVISQTTLTRELISFLALLETSNKDTKNQMDAFLQKLFTAQDNIFVIRKRYNKEVEYFNTRTSIFPGVLFAKLFGMSNLKYIGISRELFLSGEKTFGKKAS